MGLALRFVEGLVFCCLATVVILWAIDRSRGVGFEPFVVTPCVGAECVAASAEAGAAPLRRLSDLLEPRGLVVFLAADRCRLAAEVLQTMSAGAEVDAVLDFMQERGTIRVARPDAVTAIVAPGPNNDGAGDILRDGLRWQGGRGCYPIRYAPVFWPLLASWVLLIGWRIVRGGRRVLAEG